MSIISSKNNEKNNIWLKLYGSGNNKYDSKKIYQPEIVEINGIKKHIICFKETRKPHLKNGDIIYKGLLSTDFQNNICPIIVERGIVDGEVAIVENEWVKVYDWMKDYPIYCVLNDVVNINKEIEYGVSMYEIWEALGSDTYESSVGKYEDLKMVSIKHRHKSHIRLTQKSERNDR